MKALCLAVVFLPLAGALLAGLGGRRLGTHAVHWLTSTAVGLSFLFSLGLCARVFGADGAIYRETLYVWQQGGALNLHIGFLIDPLSVTMTAVVTFVSWMVHIYSIGYMRDDPGYTRFFSYISLFTFAMLMLVTADNFLQLFFGWEGVGAGFLPADRLLVPTLLGDLRQFQGFPGEPRGGPGIPAWHRRGAGGMRQPGLPGGV